MTKKKQALRCALAGLLSAALLTGCSSDLNEMMASMLQPVKAGQTISADSKWINSDIDGAILEDTQVELKDDFHTAVNKEWLLETTLDSKHNNITRFSLTTDVLNQRKLAMIKELQGDSQIPAYETSVEIDAGLLEHDGELVGKFAELAGNWEKRNALGVEPARAYIEAIETIDSMEQLDDYLLNRNGMNFTNINIIEIMIEKTFRGEAKYAVMISPTSHLSLGSQDQYTAIGNKGEVCKQMTDGQVSYLLGRMGYSTKGINSILKRCYRFEGRLAQCMKSELETSNYKTYTQEADNHYTLEELVQLSPVFPMQELIAEYGLEGQETYIVMEPDYVKGVQKLYSEKYLEEIKSYYIVQTVMQLLPLLDRESLDKYQEISKLMRVSENSDLPSPSPESEDTMLSEEEDLLLNFYFHNYLSGAFDQIYIARYCTREQKEDILDMIEQTIDVYREIILSEEWLSEEARQKTVEKLENMGIRAVYPDTFKDYRQLDFASYETDGEPTGATLVDAIAAINDFQVSVVVQRAGEPFDRNYWDLDEECATQANAYYRPDRNSITILPGIVSVEEFYDADAGDEYNLGRIGMVIGHEISHAFDTTGSQFDKDGNMETWWSREDTIRFSLRVSDLAKYYSSMTPYPGAEMYNGNTIAGEAIADMGGTKCMLAIAKKRENFDYESFFKSYAGLWSAKRTFSQETRYMMGDEHPLAFLRTNVTLQQFEEFYETFDIGPGDGMYLEPEKRITVW